MFNRVTGHKPNILCGAEGPLKKEHEAHGLASLDWGGDYRDGLCKWVSENLGPTSEAHDAGKAVPAMVELLRASEPSSVDIVAIGPLTNIAQLLAQNEELLRTKVRRVWVMGGA